MPEHRKEEEKLDLLIFGKTLESFDPPDEENTDRRRPMATVNAGAP